MNNQNPTPLKLICEEDFRDFDLIVEQKQPGARPTFKIKGPYIVTETKNANGRIYDKGPMIEAVENYIESYVKTARSLGELNHPETSEVNPERACHLLTSLIEDGTYFIGESRVLLGTPMGDLTGGLLQNGVKLGMSSRGVGNVTKNKHVDVYRLIAIDAVWNPSAPGAFVDGILESRQYMVDTHGEIVEIAYNTFQNQIDNLPNTVDVKKEKLIHAVKLFIESI